jgi:hypothetical protein
LNEVEEVEEVTATGGMLEVSDIERSIDRLLLEDAEGPRAR